MLVRKSAHAPTVLILFAVLAAGGALCFTAISGCGLWSKGDDANGESSTTTNTAHKQPVRIEPLLDGWEKPAAALVLSGEQHGYLEPCGCSETQSGGLARRHDLFRQIEERGWPVTALDLGGTVGRNREQSRYKFETIINALNTLHYEALALGPEELRFGVDYLLTRPEFSPTHSDSPLNVLGANITVLETPDLGPKRFDIIDVNGVKIGVTAVVGSSVARDVFPQGARNDIMVDDAKTALPPVIAELKSQRPALMVLLAHASLEESRELAKAFPEFPLVVSSGGPEDPTGETETVGSTMIVQVGHKGKYVGVVGFYPESKDTPLRFELVDLDNQRFKSSPEMNALMASYQQRLQEAAHAIMADIPASVHPRDAKYTGADKCGQCHKKAFAKWKDTPHARAYDSLIKGRKGQEANWVPRNHDPECLACHVTGWDPQEVLRYDSGFQLQSLTQDEPSLYDKLKGQQCENCHGPGSRHVELEEQWKADRDKVSNDQVVAARAEMKLIKERAEQICRRCHDSDNSPHFKFDVYWEKIVHPWRD